MLREAGCLWLSPERKGTQSPTEGDIAGLLFVFYFDWEDPLPLSLSLWQIAPQKKIAIKNSEVN